MTKNQWEQILSFFAPLLTSLTNFMSLFGESGGISQSVHSYVHLTVRLSLRPSICPSTCLFVHEKNDGNIFQAYFASF